GLRLRVGVEGGGLHAVEGPVVVGDHLEGVALVGKNAIGGGAHGRPDVPVPLVVLVRPDQDPGAGRHQVLAPELDVRASLLVDRDAGRLQVHPHAGVVPGVGRVRVATEQDVQAALGLGDDGLLAGVVDDGDLQPVGGGPV